MQRFGRIIATCSVAAMFVCVLLGAPSAGAQPTAGKLTLVLVKALDDGSSVQVTVRLAGPDGQPAQGAAISMSAQPSGLSGNAGRTKSTTFVASPTPGEYSGIITLPGSGNWRVKVVSVAPDATIEFQQASAGTITTLPESADSGAGSSASGKGSAGSGGAENGSPGKAGDAGDAAEGAGGESGNATAGDGKAAASGDVAADATGPGSTPSASSGPGSWVWLVGGLVAAAAVGLGVLSRSRQSPAPPVGTDASDGPPEP
jgi:hypothetical protein